MKLDICITINKVKYRWCEHCTDLGVAFAKALADLCRIIGN